MYEPKSWSGDCLRSVAVANVIKLLSLISLWSSKVPCVADKHEIMMAIEITTAISY